MPNYQPNYIYSPLYGNRYLGGSRTPAPSTGTAGQVDNSALESRNATVGVPYIAVPEQEGPIGWSGTGRDQSSVESLSSFGFRPLDTLQEDPSQNTNYFDSPEPINNTFVTPVTPIPEENNIPEVSFSNDTGGNDSYIPSYSFDNTSPYSYDSTPDNNNELIAALANYGYGFNDTPDWLQALLPGTTFAKYLSNQLVQQANEEEIAALNYFNNVPSGMHAVVNPNGTITYEYDVTNPYSDSTLTADQFAALQNQDNISISGMDASNNVNVTVTNTDGTTYDARAGVFPNTGLVNTYNFNVNETVSVPESTSDNVPDPGTMPTSNSTTEQSAASEDANVSNNDFGMTDAQQEAQDQNDQDDAEDASDGWGDWDGWSAEGGKVPPIESVDDEFLNNPNYIPDENFSLKLDDPFVEFAGSFIPGVAQAMDVRDIKKEIDDEDYLGAAGATALAAIGLIPGLGPVAKKGIKSASKAGWFDELTDLIPYEKLLQNKYPNENFLFRGLTKKELEMIKEGELPPNLIKSQKIHTAPRAMTSREYIDPKTGALIAIPIERGKVYGTRGTIDKNLNPRVAGQTEYVLTPDEYLDLLDERGFHEINLSVFDDPEALAKGFK